MLRAFIYCGHVSKTTTHVDTILTRPRQKRMTVYLSPGLRQRLDAHMKRTRLKVSSYVQMVLERDLNKQEIKADLKG